MDSRQRFGFSIVLLFVAVLIGVYAVYVALSSNIFSSPPQKITVIAPFSGVDEEYGNNVKKGVDFAIQSFDRKVIEASYIDSMCEDQPIDHYLNGIVGKKPSAIVYVGCSDEDLPRFSDKGIPVFIISPFNADEGIADDQIVKITEDYAKQADFAANYIKNEKVDRLSILYVNNNYGSNLNNAIFDKFTSLGGSVISREFFNEQGTNIEINIQKIVGLSPDAVYVISDNPNNTINILRNLKTVDSRVKIFGSNLVARRAVIESPVSNGITIISQDMGDESFISGYMAESAQFPGIYMYQGYSATNLILRSIGERGKMARDSPIGYSSYKVVDNNLVKASGTVS